MEITKELPPGSEASGTFPQHGASAQAGNENDETKPFYCMQCNESFCWLDELILHVATHANGDVFRCQKCTETFACSEHLAEHMEAHIEDFHIKQEEEECAPSDVSQNEVRDDTEESFSCMVCNELFTQLDELVEHVKSHVSADRSVACLQCGQSFSQLDDLVEHTETHRSDASFDQTACSEGDTPASANYTHIADSKSAPASNKQGTETTKDRKYVCKVCLKAFRQLGHLV